MRRSIYYLLFIGTKDIIKTKITEKEVFPWESRHIKAAFWVLP